MREAQIYIKNIKKTEKIGEWLSSLNWRWVFTPPPLGRCIKINAHMLIFIYYVFLLLGNKAAM